MKKIPFIVSLVSVVLSGCAGMSVTVDVMDPEHFRDAQVNILNSKIFRQSAIGDISPAETVIEKICTAYYETNIQLYQTAIEAQPTEPKFARLNQSTKDLKRKELEKRQKINSDQGKNVCLEDLGYNNLSVASIYDSFLDINCNSKECENNPEIEQRRRNYNLARYYTKIRSIKALAYEKIQHSQDTVSALVANNASQNISAKNNAQTEISAEASIGQHAVKSISATNPDNGYLGTNGRTLVLTDLAFAASNAPDEVWQKEYNVAKGLGTGGSLDTVIKLNSTADFSVKGLIFDARSTALTARKMTVSTLQLLAAGSGLPINATNTATTDAEGNTVQTEGKVLDENNQITSAQAEIQTDKQLSVYYDAALKQIAAITISTADQVKSGIAGSQAIKDARAANKAAFDSNKIFIEALIKED